MRKTTWIVSVFIFTWVCLGLASSNEPADRPVLQEGDRWEFKASMTDRISSSTGGLNGLYEVVYRTGKLEVFEATGSEKTPIGEYAAEELKRMILPDEREYLKFPLAVGNKWTNTHRLLLRSRWLNPSMNYAVTSVDNGRYKIEGIGRVGSSHPVSQTRVFIYSPGDKAIAKFFYDSAVGETGAKVDIELVKFTPGGK